MNADTEEKRADSDGSKIFTPEYYAELRRLEAGAWWNAGMRAIAWRLLSSVNLPQRGRLLDAGCGSGQTMAWLREKLDGWTSLGLDLSSDAIRAAHALGEPVLEASVTRLPFESSAFDLVISLDVLQHLPLNGGDAEAMSEARRVLSPGGVLLIRTNSQSFPRVPDDPTNMYRRYEPSQLKRVLEKSGFEILRLSRANSLLGLAELPRELRARRESHGASYYGLLSKPRAPGVTDAVKRGVLDIEGALISRGFTLPFGRTLFALCRAPLA